MAAQVARELARLQNCPMFMLVPCHHCNADDPNSLSALRFRVPFNGVDLSDWNCDQGHRSLFWVQNPFYQLMYLHGIEDLAATDRAAADAREARKAESRSMVLV
jgi:hypothetical protein